MAIQVSENLSLHHVRWECTLEEARAKGVTEMNTPNGVVPVPKTIEELEELKREVSHQRNEVVSIPDPNNPGKRMLTCTLYPASTGHLCVIGFDPFQVTLFWTEGASTQHIPIHYLGGPIN